MGAGSAPALTGARRQDGPVRHGARTVSMLGSTVETEGTISQQEKHRSRRPFPQTPSNVFSQMYSGSCVTDAHQAFLSHSLPSCPSLLCLLHPLFCKQTHPRFCTLHRKNKSIAVEQKPMGSARKMQLAQSASCYYGNNEGFL